MADNHDDMQAIIAARKLKLAEEAEQEQRSRERKAKRRRMNVRATLAMLLRKKFVTKEWANRFPDEATLRRRIRVACIANMVDAIDMTGGPMIVNPIIDRTNFR